MPATRDLVSETRRKGEALAYALKGLISCAPDSPCSRCHANGSECPLCRFAKVGRAALAEWEAKS